MQRKHLANLSMYSHPQLLQMGICQVHVKFALKKSNSAPKSVAAPVEEPLKRKASVKKKSESSKSAKIEKKESPEKVKPGVVNTLPPVEKEEFTIKIINFVAIKVAIEEPGPARRRSVKKRRESEDGRRGSKEKVPGLMEKPPLPSISPPPLPRDPSPPSPTPPPPKSPTPLRDPTPPPPREPTPPPPPKSPTPPPVKVSTPTPPKPSPPPSPAYQRKFFPNPVASEPYKPKIRDIPTVKPTRRRKVEEYVEEPAPLRRREVSMDVKPVKFSGVAENCIKKALFLGDQYVGEGKSKVGEQEDKRRASKQESRRSSQQESSRRSSQQGSRRVSYYESGTETETGRSRSNSKTPLRDGAGQESRSKKKKTKASTKIIDILTAKKMKDELSAGETTENGRSTPKQTRRKLSEYVSEKLRMDNNRSSKSRSNTPGSPPQRSKRIVQMRAS